MRSWLNLEESSLRMLTWELRCGRDVMDESLYHEWVELTISHPPDYQSSTCIIKRDFICVNDFIMTQLFSCACVPLEIQY